jgi:predicted nucleic acid-binding protein
MVEAASERRIYLDANVFIDAYEGEPLLSDPAAALLDALRDEPGLAVTSELSLAEVLARPEAEQDWRRKRAYLNLILWSGVVAPLPITREVLLLTGKLRAGHSPKLKLLDAIHLATASEQRCRVFVSRDDGIQVPPGMRRMRTDREGAHAILEALA